MIKVKRLRHVTFASPNVEAQLDYYQSIIGLAVIGRDDRRIVLGTDSDELTLVLEHGAASRLTAIAYEVAPGLDLSDLQKSLASLDIKSEIRSDTAPGISKTLVFNDPDGHQIELFSRWDFCKPVEPIRGLAVAKLGHVALYTPDPERAAKFFGDVLGFRVSDRIEENFVFMRCGPEHHAMNFARGTEAASIIWRSSCATPRTCIRPATCSDATSSRFSGDRYGTGPVTTWRSITTIPIAI